ncbi:MAG: hypothetical protein CL596_04645 [Alteromonas sp.]|nr:hypothetical protein [Alteromonas sp.]MAY23403.1 hypothetical protein [Flavobacteriaceae bacterium]|tara:strand:+ start:14118 stop:14954 length:837 start_codon:yes stop_codon:yes gene_type:complete
MKTILKKMALLPLLALGLIIISCNKDDAEDPEEVNFSAEDTALVAKTDNIVEGTQNIVEGGYVRIEEPGRMSGNDIFPECTSFTISGGGNNGGTIVIDFGDGCELANGAFVTGSIDLEYGPLVAGQRNITYNYVDYTYNGNSVTGGGTILRKVANGNGNPESTVNESIEVSFPDTPVTATRTGQRIAEWVDGVGSGIWADNVYFIDGNWQTNLSNGFERTGVVTETLVRKLSCLYLVSGRIEVTQEGLTGTLDFGDGDCDAIATIIFNGNEYPVVLGL